MLLEHQISILVMFLKDRVTPEDCTNDAEINLLCLQRNKYFFNKRLRIEIGDLKLQ